MTAAAISVRMLEGMTTALSRHALVYTGLTGDPFFVSARRAKALADAGSRSRRKLKSERTSSLSVFRRESDAAVSLLDVVDRRTADVDVPLCAGNVLVRGAYPERAGVRAGRGCVGCCGDRAGWALLRWPSGGYVRFILSISPFLSRLMTPAGWTRCTCVTALTKTPEISGDWTFFPR